ncbi:Protein of uncharacterised function (DUF2845) [Legionella steigerwaltii]|uniref:Protein of uncharacterized function (DUF2845) n=1 Tax=Legionella steigerwaltii TaxID=460 RepID=A0A378LC14_9GAMM|nr:DUF2845 domain-containing protein [Legionella steigerwaltii]KTD71702.1 hypothetical protein Lstg_2910 [Legionella steigerwaltii]STY23870.1 Protein of uncharacterised function (DUF2845) [Legionella steigerwaltii]
MKKILLFVLLILSINYSWAVQCNSALIDEGDSQATVLRKCGDPQDKKTLSTTQPLFNSAGVQYGSVPFLTEVWTYHTPGDFIYKVYFTDKKVTSITTDVAFPD